MNRISGMLASTLAVILMTAPAHAAIIILDTATGGNNTYSPNSLSFGSITLAGADKLVVTLVARDTAGINTVSYNGQTMTKAVSQQASSVGATVESSIWYLDNPGTTTGNLTFAGALRGIAASAWVLSGTADGVGSVGHNTGSSTSLATTADSSLVIANSGFYLKTSPAPTAPVGQSPLTDGPDLLVNYINRGEYNALGTGYQMVATAGSVTPTFHSGDATVAAEFLAVVIPEPTTSALVGLVLTAALLRRRRA